MNCLIQSARWIVSNNSFSWTFCQENSIPYPSLSLYVYLERFDDHTTCFDWGRRSFQGWNNHQIQWVSYLNVYIYIFYFREKAYDDLPSRHFRDVTPKRAVEIEWLPAKRAMKHQHLGLWTCRWYFGSESFMFQFTKAQSTWRLAYKYVIYYKYITRFRVIERGGRTRFFLSISWALDKNLTSLCDVPKQQSDPNQVRW